ncbi:hypothetical protein glysoja_020939 [Glycine soja]|nr:hypothetical protein glysoja_020939 [Glycine soja]
MLNAAVACNVLGVIRLQTPRSGFGNTGIGQSGFGGQQQSGSRVASYTATTESKLVSISAIPIHKDKSHEQLRWEDYQLGDKDGHLSTQSTGLTGFSLYQSSANSFSTTTPNSNPFKIEKYKEMLKRMVEDQGADFVSYDPIKGEWKIRVKHFSVYKLVPGR